MKGFSHVIPKLHKPLKYYDLYYLSNRIQWFFNELWKQYPFKIDQKTTCKMECYMLHPFEAPRRPKIASDGSKMAPRRPKDGLLALKTAPRRPQDRPKTPPGGLLEPLWRPLDAPSALRSPHDAPRSRFWSLQTSILEPVDLDFGASEPRFWRFSTSELIYNII